MKSRNKLLYTITWTIKPSVFLFYINRDSTYQITISVNPLDVLLELGPVQSREAAVGASDDETGAVTPAHVSVEHETLRISLIAVRTLVRTLDLVDQLQVGHQLGEVHEILTAELTTAVHHVLAEVYREICFCLF